MYAIEPKIKIIPHIQANTQQGGAIYNAISQARPLLIGIKEPDLGNLEIEIDRSNGNGAPNVRFKRGEKQVQGYLKEVEKRYTLLFSQLYQEGLR